jgi:3-oxoacyl-[acyl-carrier protein] reductase
VSLNGRVALVTGGSRGIGRAIVTRLAQDGADIVINYRSAWDEAEEVARQLAAESRRAITVQANVCDPKQATELVERVVDEFGRLDMLVNNVGEFALGTAGSMSPARWREVLDSNLNSAFYVTNAALPTMRAQPAFRRCGPGLVCGSVV